MSGPEVSGWLNKYGPRLVNPIATTRQTVLMMLHAGFIWDTVRKHYVDSRRREYEEHRRQLRASYYEEDADIVGPETRLEQVVDVKTGDRHQSQLDDLLEREFDCPIPPMPARPRVYQILSTSYVAYASIKYLLICAIYYRWIHVDQTYACYLPGRIGLLPFRGVLYESHWFGAIIFIYHLIWRAMWFSVDRIELDSLLFLYYDKDTILDKQYQVIELNNPSMTPPDVAYRRYLCNKVFYQRRTDHQGRAFYCVRPHRTVEHYEHMEEFLVKLRLLYIYGVSVCFMMIIATSLYTYTRHDYFDMAYPSCRSFASAADDANFRWSFGDKFRLLYLLFDLLDGIVFLVDTAVGFSLPFMLAFVITHDLCLRFDALRHRVRALNDKYRYFSLNTDPKLKIRSPTMAHPIFMCIKQLQQEADSIFNDVIGIFEQVNSADEVARRLATYTISCWLLFIASYQAASILNLVPDDGVVRIMNALGISSCSGTLLMYFLMIARPYNRAQRLYAELCIAMALCPTIPKSKIAWRWLIEYYKDANKYSLHLLGKTYTLSNLNVLRCVSWFVTCLVITISLLKR